MTPSLLLSQKTPRTIVMKYDEDKIVAEEEVEDEIVCTIKAP